VIEITEHEFLGDDAALEYAVTRLRERGARIALDDAGAGYAGLHQLLRLRPDVVKLDRSLVGGVSGDPHRSALIAALVSFATDVGMSVCAEGIEREDDYAALVSLGVESGQGWLIARPATDWPLPHTPPRSHERRPPRSAPAAGPSPR
jgi:EAL domain-containing protein (putative c-di-GMP-specific phosphodiesterase class I)